MNFGGLDDPKINVADLQRVLFQGYEGNSVLCDAIQRRQSIEESLKELGQVNRGIIRKAIPHRINRGHNERLEQLGELVSEPHHLRTSGILMPDNFISTGAIAAVMYFGMFHFLNMSPGLHCCISGC